MWRLGRNWHRWNLDGRVNRWAGEAATGEWLSGTRQGHEPGTRKQVRGPAMARDGPPARKLLRIEQWRREARECAQCAATAPYAATDAPTPLARSRPAPRRLGLAPNPRMKRDQPRSRKASLVCSHSRDRVLFPFLRARVLTPLIVALLSRYFYCCVINVCFHYIAKV